MSEVEETQEKPIEKPLEEKKEIKTIELKDGLLETKDLNEEWRVAQLMLSSKALPAQFENVQQVVMTMQVLKSLNINPMLGIRHTMIVNGNISLWGDLPLAICRNSGQLESFKEFFIDSEYKEICFENKNLDAPIFAAICQIKRKGIELTTRSFTVNQAKQAGIWGTKVWAKYPSRMIQMRTRSLALKDIFSDVLSGISINEYDIDGINTSSIANEINNEFLEKETNQEQDVVEFN